MDFGTYLIGLGVAMLIGSWMLNKERRLRRLEKIHRREQARSVWEHWIDEDK
jgi:uncharacterized BrkB/YihY/UPF0761 family membrane protein